MTQDIVITFEGKYLKVVTHGGGYDFAQRLWIQVRDACHEHNCFLVLGIGYTTSLKTIEAFNHAQLFRELGISHRFRIAWVERNSAVKEALAFTETVLMNRSLPGRLFFDIPEAEQWLLEGVD